LRPLDALRMVDYGDVEVVPPSITDTFRNAEAEVSAILESGATVLALGGDHSVSLPLLRAHARRFGPLSVVHFDSHPDTWDSEYPGQPYSHGTIYRRAIEEGLIRPEAYIQIGLRGSTSGVDDWDWARQRGVRVLSMDEAAALGAPAIIEAIQATASGPVYVTFDIDVADPAFAPGTGTPEVGGFTSHELLHLVRGLKGLNLVGFDLVEVNPLFDHGDITALLAANIAFEFVALLAAQRGQKAV
jgi:agmatinase